MTEIDYARQRIRNDIDELLRNAREEREGDRQLRTLCPAGVDIVEKRHKIITINPGDY